MDTLINTTLWVLAGYGLTLLVLGFAIGMCVDALAVFVAHHFGIERTMMFRLDPAKVLLIAGVVIFAVLVWAGSRSQAKAAECFPFELAYLQEVQAGRTPMMLDSTHLPKIVTDVEMVLNTKLGTVTRGFMELTPTLLTVGLEVDGCILPAMHFPTKPELGPTLTPAEGASGASRV